MNNMPSTSTLSVTQKLLKFLQTGRDITANQARAKFGITNVSARMSELRKAGYAIYLNEKTTPSGYTIKAYRLGTPTRRMVAVANFVDSNPGFYGKASWINDRASRNMRNATV
jgi:predicted transcriptional regulator